MKSERPRCPTARQQRPGAWKWREGPVYKRFDHFELHYGEACASGGVDTWIPVAIVGRVAERRVNAQFLIDRGNPRNSKIAEDVVKELKFFLGELNEPDPWRYLQYHCGTASNVYGSVHWSFMNASANNPMEPENPQSLST